MKLLQKHQPTYPDLFCAFLPVLIGCCLAVPLNARYQAGFWQGSHPGVLHYAWGIFSRFQADQKGFVVRLIPPNLNLDLVFARSMGEKLARSFDLSAPTLLGEGRIADLGKLHRGAG